MLQKKKPQAVPGPDLNAHEEFFAERVAQKMTALVNDEWIAAGGERLMRPQAVATALQIALDGV